MTCLMNYDVNHILKLTFDIDISRSTGHNPGFGLLSDSDICFDEK